MSFVLQAQTFIPAQAQDNAPKYFAEIEVHTSEELYYLLAPAEERRLMSQENYVYF